MRYQAQDLTTPSAPRRLYRSSDDRMIAGVCGGLARYAGVDPVVVRIGAVVLALAGGAGLPAYLAAWLLVPPTGADSARGSSAAPPVRVFNLVDEAPMTPAHGSARG